MPATIVVDRYGRRLVGRRVVPDGGCVVVPLPFRDALSARTQRAFGDGLLHRPGFAQQALGDGFAATTSNERSQSASEAARQDYINRISNQWRQTWQQMPSSAHKPKPGLASYDPSADDGAALDPSERAYLECKQGLQDMWRGPVADDDTDTDDNATMGMVVGGSDLPDDIQQRPLAEQYAYVAAFNQHMEENPEADFAECDEAARAAIPRRDSIEDAEAIRQDAQRRYCERVANAWRTR
jgi:hypothetical protein